MSITLLISEKCHNAKNPNSQIIKQSIIKLRKHGNPPRDPMIRIGRFLNRQIDTQHIVG
jgi:hypothetical protein